MNYKLYLGNENCTARSPLPVHLEKRWNKVLLKLPVGAGNDGVSGRYVMPDLLCVMPDVLGHPVAERDCRSGPAMTGKRGRQ